MENRIEILEPTTLVGKSLEMSLADDRTLELWQSFGPFVKRIENRKDQNLISMQNFHRPFDPNKFDPEAVFTKWAAAAIHPMDPPQNSRMQLGNGALKLYQMPGGLYAVFKHVGRASEFGRSMAFIYGKWFANQPYVLDNREHFEVLPPGYRPDDPEAEEEIWIPVKRK